MNLAEINLSDLNDLDFKESGSWPLPGRIVAVTLIFIAVIAAGYWFLISDNIDQLHQAERKEITLRQQFESKQAQAANLDAYKKQLADMRTSFGAMLRQLPGETEMDSLLQDVSQTAQSNGLKQDLFKPEAEVDKDFYAEKPIQIKVEGNYHQFAKFVSDVAALPRIVTLHNVQIEPKDKTGRGSDELVMQLTAKTYRYLDEVEKQQQEVAKK
jgi:type IV pilus assembly protein PilO